jgi:hypothetical protein
MYLDVLRLHWIWCHQSLKTRKAAQKAADAAEATTLTLAQKKKIVCCCEKVMGSRTKIESAKMSVNENSTRFTPQRKQTRHRWM